MSKRNKSGQDVATKEKRLKTGEEEEKKTEEEADKSLKDPPTIKTDAGARYFGPAKCKVLNAHALVWEEADGIPQDAAAVWKLVEANKLRLGDIVNFGGFRDSQSYVVLVDPKENTKISLVRNRDDSGAGYLSIPEDVLRHITNFRQIYADVIEQSKIYIHFRLNSTDSFIDEKLSFLGDKTAEGWLFDIVYHKGDLHQFTAYSPDGRSETFDLEKSSWDSIKEFFQTRAEGALGTIRVHVSLLGDKYQEYKSKFSGSDAGAQERGEWMKAAPDLPTGWSSERGQSKAGSDHFNWTWVFTGPASTEDKAKESLEKFLEGFTFTYVDGA